MIDGQATALEIVTRPFDPDRHTLIAVYDNRELVFSLKPDGKVAPRKIDWSRVAKVMNMCLEGQRSQAGTENLGRDIEGESYDLSFILLTETATTPDDQTPQ